MLRRLGVSALTAVCLVALSGAALGATFSDTAGTKYEDAVDLLTSLGLLGGYPDGTFRPDEPVSRAEGSKLAVLAYGLGEAAASRPGVARFSDVPADHWAAGFVGVAADLGLVHGYHDGTFLPDAPVTYGEVLAILVRLLGYEPAVSGPWPTGYVVKALELGLTRGVSFPAGAPATRGDVALFLRNALTAPLMEEVTSRFLVPIYAVSDPPKTLLGDRLGYRVVVGWVEDVPRVFGSPLDPDEVRLDDGDEETHDVYRLAPGYTFDPDWLGLEVRAWCGGDGVVAVQVLTAEEDVVSGLLEHISVSDAEVRIGKRTYDLADAWRGWSQNTLRTDTEVEDDDPDFEQHWCRAVREGGDVRSLYAWQYDDSLVLTAVRAPRVEGVNEAADYPPDDFRLSADDRYDEIVLLRDGAPAVAEDFTEGDVVAYYETGDNAWFQAVSDKVSGKLERVRFEDGDICLTVDGEVFVTADPSTLSRDGNKELWEVVGDEATLEDFLGEDVTLFLAEDGSVRHLSGAMGSPVEVAVIASEFYKVVSPDRIEGEAYYIRLLTVAGDLVKARLTERSLFDGKAPGQEGWPGLEEIDADPIDPDTPDPYDLAYPKTTLVQGAVGEDGALESLVTVAPVSTFQLLTADVDADGWTVHGLRVRSKAVFLDCCDPDLGSWKALTWDVFRTITVSEEGLTNASAYRLVGAAVVYLVYSGGSVSYGEAGRFGGVVTGRDLTPDGVELTVVAVDEDGDDLEGRFLVVSEDTPTKLPTVVTALDGTNRGESSDDVRDLDSGDYVEFEVAGREYVSVFEPEAMDPVGLDYTAYVGDWDEEDLILIVSADPEGPLPGDPVLLADPDCLVFDLTGESVVARLGDVREGDLVQVLDSDGDGLVDAIKILPKE